MPPRCFLGIGSHPQGPVGLLDVATMIPLDLLLRDPDQGFQCWSNPPRFQAASFPVPALPARYLSMPDRRLATSKAPLRTNQQEDAILVSDQGMQVFQISQWLDHRFFHVCQDCRSQGRKGD